MGLAYEIVTDRLSLKHNKPFKQDICDQCHSGVGHSEYHSSLIISMRECTLCRQSYKDKLLGFDLFTGFVANQI